MNEQIPLAWKSVAVLPPLIVVSALVALAVAFGHRLPVPHALGLLVVVLAIVEIGYLLFLIAAHRRGPSPHLRPSRER